MFEYAIFDVLEREVSVKRIDLTGPAKVTISMEMFGLVNGLGLMYKLHILRLKVRCYAGRAGGEVHECQDAR